MVRATLQRIRSEYPFAISTIRRAIELSRSRVAPFVVEVREGAGAYVCGEETALLDSIEGKRGQVRAKPPLPALKGLFGQPTVINNVLSLAAVPSDGPLESPIWTGADGKASL